MKWTCSCCSSSVHSAVSIPEGEGSFVPIMSYANYCVSLRTRSKNCTSAAIDSSEEQSVAVVRHLRWTCVAAFGVQRTGDLLTQAKVINVLPKVWQMQLVFPERAQNKL